MREIFEQKMVAQYLDGKGFLWCHVPNEGKHHVSYRKSLRLQGLKSGVPDILIFKRPTNPKYQDRVGLAIELKKVGGPRPTKNQRKWLNDLSANDWITAACYGHHAAIGLIEEIYIKKVDKKN